MIVNKIDKYVDIYSNYYFDLSLSLKFIFIINLSIILLAYLVFLLYRMGLPFLGQNTKIKGELNETS